MALTTLMLLIATAARSFHAFSPRTLHISSCRREGEILRISLRLKTILAQIKCSYTRFMSWGARGKYLQGSVSCGVFSTDGHTVVKTVIRLNKSQPETLFIQACSRTFGTPANLWPRGTSAATHLLENPILSAWIANRLANIW